MNGFGRFWIIYKNVTSRNVSKWSECLHLVALFSYCRHSCKILAHTKKKYRKNHIVLHKCSSHTFGRWVVCLNEMTKCWTNIQQILRFWWNICRLIVLFEFPNMPNGLLGHNLIAISVNWKIGRSFRFILNLNFVNFKSTFLFISLSYHFNGAKLFFTELSHESINITFSYFFSQSFSFSEWFIFMINGRHSYICWIFEVRAEQNLI